MERVAGTVDGCREHGGDSPAADSLELARVFVATVARYRAMVLPSVTRQIGRWRARAREIPDPVLRALALRAMAKRGNLEGAGLFAVFARDARHVEAARALVAFQAAYNFLDVLAEQPSADPVGNGRRLHQALLVALDPDAAHADHYAGWAQREDGGYLTEMLDTCREVLRELPSHATVAGPLAVAAARIVDFQSLNLTVDQGGADGLERWGHEQILPASGLSWWETAAGGGSSLAVHALIGAAADRGIDGRHVAAIESAYFPWIGALHSLLDSMVDVAEDEREGQRNLLGYYSSPHEAAVRLSSLAESAKRATRSLRHGHQHRVVLSAMASYYLSAPEASTGDARVLSASVADALGAPLRPALGLFAARRSMSRLTRRPYL